MLKVRWVCYTVWITKERLRVLLGLLCGYIDCLCSFGKISVSLSRVLDKDEAVKGKRLLWIISCFNCYLVAIIHGVFFTRCSENHAY